VPANNTRPIAKQGTLTDPALAAHAAAIHHLAGRVVADVIEIGRRLTDAKRICGHGNFLPWLKREFHWSEKTAENYMRVYALSTKFETVSNLDVPIKALYLLASPSTPKEARDAIIERAQAGKSIPLAEIKQTIDTAKGRQQPAKKKRLHRGEVLRGGRSRSASVDLIADMEEIDPEHGRAKALAIMAGVPHEEAIGATRGTVGTLVSAALAPAAAARDDIGPDSNGEIARKDARIEELQTEKRRLEIENLGLRSEIEDAKAEPAPKSKSRCSICRKRAVLRRVFVCDLCAEIHELETAADATPAASS
jgi:hypothetical protein